MLIVSPLRGRQSIFESIVLFILATLVDANVIEDLQIVKHLGKKNHTFGIDFLRRGGAHHTKSCRNASVGQLFLWFDLTMSDLLLVYAAEVAVAKAVVDLCDVGEELRLLDPCEREGGLLTCVHRSYT